MSEFPKMLGKARMPALCTAALAIALVVGCSRPSSSGTFITLTKFGLVGSDGSIVEARQIPHQPGTLYGWSLQVTPTLGSTRIKEVFTLPEGGKFESKPGTNPGELKNIEYQISDDGREQTETFLVRSRRQFTIIDKYAVSSDDPVGTYRIKLFVNDIEVADFEFEVAD